MYQELNTSSAQLTGAFQVFKDTSRKLIDSYQALEKQVVRLRSELSTAQNERLEQLTEKERLATRQKHLIEAIPAGIIILDGQGAVHECNPAAVTLLGRPLCGMLWRDVVEQVFHPQPDDGHDLSLRNGKRVSVATCSLGSEPGQVLLIQDVTETRAMQMQLARLERLSEMGRMLASLAHQIRTPLASALLHASNLRVLHKGTQGEKVRARLLERLRHLEHLVTDILCFARHGRFEVEEIDVCDLLEQFVHSLEPQLSARCVHLEFQNASSSTFIRGNREALESALQNVANNAIQAGGEESNLKLAVRLNSPERVVHISLTDTGPGIPANLHDRVFEAFFTTRKDGTGLGLATVRAIVEAHRGRVQLVSAPGEGATVTVTLPLSG